ncbi:MAG: phage portal protein [Rhizobiaceae bacterium]
MNWNWPWKRGPARSREPVETKNALSGGFIAWHSQSDASWTRRDFAALAREGFMRNPVVHRCVKLVGEAALAVPWLLYDNGREFDDHPLLRLLVRPNGRLAGPAFMEALYGHLLLSGNAYIELVGEDGGPRELHLIRPDRTRIVTDSRGWPDRLEVNEGTTRRTIPLEGEPAAPARHLTMFHPLDDHYGFAPLEAASVALDLNNATARWNKALLDNSARPSGALVYAPKEGGNLTEEQYDRLQAELENGFSGPPGAGKPLLLDGGLDWKAMGLTPRDMDFIEAKNAASRDIALAFGVPPMLLGIPGDNTYSNYREANRAFYRMTVLPLVGRAANELGAWLGPFFEGNLRLWYDADQIDAMAADREAHWTRIGSADFLTDDEKRQAVGYPPRDAGVGGPS